MSHILVLSHVIKAGLDKARSRLLKILFEDVKRGSGREVANNHIKALLINEGQVVRGEFSLHDLAHKGHIIAKCLQHEAIKSSGCS